MDDESNWGPNYMKKCYLASKIEAQGTNDADIEELAKKLSTYILEKEEIATAAALYLNLICGELLNIEQRQQAGYKPIHQQIMLGRWTNLLNFLRNRLQGVSIIYEPGDAALKYFERHRAPAAEIAENKEPSTKRAKKAFAAAMEAGYMQKTDTGYKWLYNRGSQSSLVYFLVKAYDPDNTEETPFIALGKLFGVTRLDSAADKALNPKKPQRWRDKIDELLKDLPPGGLLA